MNYAVKHHPATVFALHSRKTGTLLFPLVLAPSSFLLNNLNNFSIFCIVPLLQLWQLGCIMH